MSNIPLPSGSLQKSNTYDQHPTPRDSKNVAAPLTVFAASRYLCMYMSYVDVYICVHAYVCMNLFSKRSAVADELDLAEGGMLIMK